MRRLLDYYLKLGTFIWPICLYLSLAGYFKYDSDTLNKDFGLNLTFQQAIWIFLVLTSISILYISAKIVFGRLKEQDKKEIAEIIEIHSKVISFCNSGIEKCDNLMGSEQLKHIVLSHTSTVNSYFAKLSKSVLSNVNSVIDKEFLSQAIEASKSKQNEQTFQVALKAAYDKLGESDKTIAFLKSTSDSASINVKDALLAAIKAENAEIYSRHLAKVHSPGSAHPQPRFPLLRFLNA